MANGAGKCGMVWRPIAECDCESNFTVAGKLGFGKIRCVRLDMADKNSETTIKKGPFISTKDHGLAPVFFLWEDAVYEENPRC